jgi:hypothetical protein
MSDQMKMGVVRATALAVANAAVKHIELGLFISEFKIDDYTLRWNKLAGNAYVMIEGRTNIGLFIWISCAVIFKEPRSEDFPIEKVFVSFRRPQGAEASVHEYDFFECTFDSSSINFRRMSKSPFDENSAITA